MIEQQAIQQPAQPRKTSTDRVHAFRARQRAKAAAEAKRIAQEVKAAHRAELDAKRAAKGLQPAFTNLELQRRWQARQDALKATIEQSWYAPWLSDSEFEAYAKQHGWNSSTTGSRKESYRRACSISQVNLNRFVLANFVSAAVEARFLFNEAFKIKPNVVEALELTKTLQTAFTGRDHIEQTLNREERYQDAMNTWGDGAEIVTAIRTGRKPILDGGQSLLEESA